MNIMNFFIYFNSDEKVFLGEKCKDQATYLKEMKDLIFNENNKNSDQIKSLEYLLNFSTTGKMI